MPPVNIRHLVRTLNGMRHETLSQEYIKLYNIPSPIQSRRYLTDAIRRYWLPRPVPVDDSTLNLSISPFMKFVQSVERPIRLGSEDSKAYRGGILASRDHPMYTEISELLVQRFYATPTLLVTTPATHSKCISELLRYTSLCVLDLRRPTDIDQSFGKFDVVVITRNLFRTESMKRQLRQYPHWSRFITMDPALFLKLNSPSVIYWIHYIAPHQTIPLSTTLNKLLIKTQMDKAHERLVYTHVPDTSSENMNEDPRIQVHEHSTNTVSSKPRMSLYKLNWELFVTQEADTLSRSITRREMNMTMTHEPLTNYTSRVAEQLNEACPVCFLDGDYSATLISCGHILCKSCCTKLPMTSCPMCRQEFTRDQCTNIVSESPDSVPVTKMALLKRVCSDATGSVLVYCRWTRLTRILQRELPLVQFADPSRFRKDPKRGTVVFITMSDFHKEYKSLSAFTDIHVIDHVIPT